MEHSHQSLTFKKKDKYERSTKIIQVERYGRRIEKTPVIRRCAHLVQHLVIQCRFQHWKRERMLKNVINMSHCATFIAKEREEWKNQILAVDSNQR